MIHRWLRCFYGRCLVLMCEVGVGCDLRQCCPCELVGSLLSTKR